MSESLPETPDPLLAALRALPSRASGTDSATQVRMQRQARAAYVQSFEGSRWSSSAASLLGRALVPVFLACVVGLYMTWAIATATALVQ